MSHRSIEGRWRWMGPWWLWMVAFGGLVGAAVMLAAGAKADIVSDRAAALKVIICSTIDKYPSVAGVSGVALGLMDDGATPAQAGDMILTSVEDDCPYDLPILRAFVNTYAPGATSAPAPDTRVGFVA
jgi:hypothetical protein